MFLCFSLISTILFNVKNNIKAEENYQLTNEFIEEHDYEQNVSDKPTEQLKVNNMLNEVSYMETSSNEWKIKIPSINLEANIAEGTSKEILDEYIGHFEETKRNLGNIGLAGHNRGYRVNYFERLKEVQKGDLVYYTYKDVRRTYIITSKEIIKDTEWSSLENTEDNRLTLITCVENKPELRRCLQAVELK